MAGCRYYWERWVYIFCPLFCQQSIKRFDPSSKQSSLSDAESHLFGKSMIWKGGALGIDNGYIYCFPWSATQFLKIDTTNKTTSLVGNKILGKGYANYSDGCQTLDGKLYSVPQNHSHII